MQKLKTGIIGCGKVGYLHAQAMVESDLADLKAVCDISRANRERMADRYGVNAYPEPEEMIRKEKLEAVTVCTPHPVHHESAVPALRAGVHVLVEKPLASSLEDCDQMINASAGSGSKLGVISQRRLYPGCMRIREALDQGRIGKPVLGTVNMLGWRDRNYYASDDWRGTWKGEGGGVLVNQAPHQLDLLQWFMGEIDELYGIACNLNHPYIEVEDTALAVLKFKNGGIGNIIVSNSQKPGLFGKVHIHGETGASVGVQTDGGAMFIAGMTSIQEPPVNDLWTIPGEEHLLDRWVKEDTALFNRIDPTVYFHKMQIGDFLRCIRSGSEPLVDGIQGRVTVEIFTAIYRSGRDGKPVKWPLMPEKTGDFDGRLELNTGTGNRAAAD